ncbi:MAG: hypothetical protein WD096_01635, partial [Actinomycetota bacterium]
ACEAGGVAGAKSCILPAADDPRSAEEAADEWVATNSSAVVVGPANITALSGCDSDQPNGYVSVRYSAPQDLFFAPVLGAPSSGQVTTEATAVWGPPSAANPLPLVIYQNAYHSCRIDVDELAGPECYVWEDNNNTQGSQSGFGWLDLRTDDPTRYGWGSDKGANCTGQNADQWVANYPDPNVGDLPSNYPAPTYVCRLTGEQSNAWSSMYDLIDDDDVIDQDDDEDIIFFPINRCYGSPTGNETDGQVDAPNNNSAPVACGNIPHQYDIVGFVAFKLKAIYTPNEAQPTVFTCGPFARPFPNASPLSLDAAGVTEGCFASAPANIDAASVSLNRVGAGSGGNAQPQRGPDGSTCSGLVNDYCYDPATRQIIWNSFGPIAETSPDRVYNVEFKWSNTGPCGTPPAGNNSGHCMVVEFVRVRIGGSGPGEGNPDSNLRAYKLCEPTIASTCAPIVVPVT